MAVSSNFSEMVAERCAKCGKPLYKASSHYVDPFTQRISPMAQWSHDDTLCETIQFRLELLARLKSIDEKLSALAGQE